MNRYDHENHRRARGHLCKLCQGACRWTIFKECRFPSVSIWGQYTFLTSISAMRSWNKRSRGLTLQSRTKDITRRRASITARASQALRSRGASRATPFGALFSLEDSRIEFANLQIGFQLAYYRVRLFRLKAGGKGINVDTPRKAGGLLQRPVSHCLRCCSLPCIQSPPFALRFPGFSRWK